VYTVSALTVHCLYWYDLVET